MKKCKDCEFAVSRMVGLSSGHYVIALACRKKRMLVGDLDAKFCEDYKPKMR